MKLKIINMYFYRRILGKRKHCNVCKLSKLKINRTGKQTNLWGTLTNELDIQRYCEYLHKNVIDESENCDKFTELFEFKKLDIKI